jgi:glycosyltransferase involved in cell wall biosynthesis
MRPSIQANYLLVLSENLGWSSTCDIPKKPALLSNMPKISIVTPSYNQAKFLEEAIRSVLLQGYPNLEYIIMDGGSTDGSKEIIQKYRSLLSYVRIGPDGGQAAAIAEGFNHASGDILAWLNSDDRYLPGALFRVAQFFTTHPDVVFISGDVNFINVQGQILERIYSVRPNRTITANIGIHCWPQPGCFWRRWAYQEAGGIDTSLQFCMDRDLFIRLIGIGKGARIPGPPLADFRIHDEAKSSKMLEIADREDQLIIDRYSSPELKKFSGLLKLYWYFWGLPVRARSLYHRLFKEN